MPSLFRPFCTACGIAVIAWSIGLYWFIRQIPLTSSSLSAPIDAIVVLTGGSLRLEEGLSLLISGQGKKLFISGVAPGVEVASLYKERATLQEALHGKITVGHHAHDTHSNAAETSEWMQQEGFQSLRLVTANYHLPRSLLAFRHAMPSATIIPHPVFPESVKIATWWRYPGTAWLLISEFHKYMGLRALSWWEKWTFLRTTHTKNALYCKGRFREIPSKGSV